MFFLRPSGVKYVDRGDFSGWDKETGDFTKDNTWRVFDFSGIIPLNTKLVFIAVTVQSPASTASLQLRTNGNTNIFNIAAFQSCVANMKTEYSSFVKPSKIGYIDYKASVDTFNTLNLGIRGWLV